LLQTLYGSGVFAPPAPEGFVDKFLQGELTGA
jgi:hypothetical protein